MYKWASKETSKAVRFLTTMADRKLVAVNITLARHPGASPRVKVNRTVNGVVILKFVAGIRNCYHIGNAHNTFYCNRQKMYIRNAA